MAPYVEVVSPSLGRGAGTCIEVDSEVLVLTAGHVVKGYALEARVSYRDAEGVTHEQVVKKITHPLLLKISGRDAQQIQADVVWYSATEDNGGCDLALLRPSRPDLLSPAKVIKKPDLLRVGETVWYIGTPGGIHARLEKSIVSIPDFLWLDRFWTITNGCGYYGSSGGGLYVKRGGEYVLAGVTTRGDAGSPKGMLMAKTPADIHEFLASYRMHKGRK